MPLPLDLQLQFNQAQRRSRLADMLMAQALQPPQAPQTGAFAVPISPLQGVAKLAQAFVAGRAGRDINAQEQNLVKGYQGRMKSAAERLADALSGQQPASPAPSAPAPAVQSFPLAAAPHSAPLTISGTGGAETMAAGPAADAGAPTTTSAVTPAVTPRQRVVNALLQFGADTGDTSSVLPSVVSTLTKPDTLHAIGQGGVLYDATTGQIVARGEPKNKLRTVISGTQEYQQEQQPDGTWKTIGTGPRFNPKAGTAVTLNYPREYLKESEPLRKDEATALAPLNVIDANISKINQLLNTDSPAAARQLNVALTDLFTKTRNTNLLFKENKNFGSLAQRLSGIISQAFTGQYSDAQRAQIRDMVNQYRNQLIVPTRNLVNQYYRGLAKAGGLPPDLVTAPDFYSGSSSATDNSSDQSQADAYLRSIGAK